MEQNNASMLTRSQSPKKDVISSQVSDLESSKPVTMQTETLTSLLKPALVNSTKARFNGELGRSNSCKTPSPRNRKPMKQIRFDLGNMSKDDSWLSPTPPPKARRAAVRTGAPRVLLIRVSRRVAQFPALGRPRAPSRFWWFRGGVG